MKTVPFPLLAPRLVRRSPTKVLLIGTLAGTTSAEEVLALRRVCELAGQVQDSDELTQARAQARAIRLCDEVLVRQRGHAAFSR